MAVVSTVMNIRRGETTGLVKKKSRSMELRI
jgi:hypothetical protein